MVKLLELKQDPFFQPALGNTVPCFLRHEICEPLSKLLPIFHVEEHLLNGEISGIDIIIN